MKSGVCPNCEEMVNVGDSPLVGNFARCESCGAELIIVWLNPLELDFAYYPEDEDYLHEEYDDFER
jgi:lysine biosynthesis protein LysW